MKSKNALGIAKNRLLTKWFVCRITSGRKSAQYGLRFSYPLYISIVVLGLYLKNPYILSMTAIIAVMGIILPMHPFDYVYNYVSANILKIPKIPGRGSELQVSSIAAFIFNLIAIVSIINEVHINYSLLTLVYVLSSIFFIAMLLIKEDFSIYTIHDILFKRRR